MQEEVFEGLNEQPAIYEAVRANVQKQQDKVRKRKQEQGWDDHVKVGDVVLKNIIREDQRKGNKIELKMLGPYTITEIKEKVVYSVGNKQDKHFANLDQLSRYLEPEERIPAKLKPPGTFIPSSWSSLSPTVTQPLQSSS